MTFDHPGTRHIVLYIDSVFRFMTESLTSQFKIENCRVNLRIGSPTYCSPPNYQMKMWTVDRLIFCLQSHPYIGTLIHFRNDNHCTNRMIYFFCVRAESLWECVALWCVMPEWLCPSVVLCFGRWLIDGCGAWAVFIACWNLLCVNGAAGAEYNTGQNSKCPWNKTIH